MISAPKKPLPIRAHHGMCLAFFEGKGYSDGFTAHMGDVLHTLKEDTPIQVCREKDIICKACPNLQNGICASESIVNFYDDRVLELCELHPGQHMTWGTFSGLTADRILRPGLRSSICGRCQWDDICRRKNAMLFPESHSGF